MEWEAIEAASRSWANPYEVALARTFVERLSAKDAAHPDMPTAAPLPHPGYFSFRIAGPDTAAGAQAAQLAGLKKALSGGRVLGLTARPEIPERPDGPGVACEIHLVGGASDARLDVRIASTSTDAQRWVAAGRFSVGLRDESDKERTGEQLADAVAAQAVSTLVRAEVTPGPRVKGKPSYLITVRNASPMVLCGLAVTGQTDAGKPTDPSLLSGLCVPPRKSLKVPASAEFVERLKLKKGVKVVAADLSGV
jgi:hypothetical protein